MYTLSEPHSNLRYSFGGDIYVYLWNRANTFESARDGDLKSDTICLERISVHFDKPVSDIMLNLKILLHSELAYAPVGWQKVGTFKSLEYVVFSSCVRFRRWVIEREEDARNRTLYQKHLQDMELLANAKQLALPEPAPLPMLPALRQEIVKSTHKRQIAKSGYVYLVQSPTGNYKIGHTVNPDDRMRTFSVKLPFEVELLHTIKCKDRFAAERKLHMRYADKRVGGEWFALDPEDVERIKAVQKM